MSVPNAHSPAASSAASVTSVISRCMRSSRLALGAPTARAASISAQAAAPLDRAAACALRRRAIALDPGLHRG